MNTLHFYCVLCGAPMNAAPDIPGGVADCPRCRRMVPVPPSIEGKSMDWPGTWPPDIFSIEIKFPCPRCGSRLGVDAHRAGTLVPCPVCTNVIRIPHVASLGVAFAETARIAKADTAHSLHNLSAEEIEFLQNPAPTATAAGKSPNRDGQSGQDMAV